jgi:glycosyltransferase involved in cell wall biosynthesis/GT2 family glycosyltransferase
LSKRCDVIIPVKNAPWWLGACLDALDRNTSAEDLGRVLVVDDGSTEDSWLTIQRVCDRPGVQFMRNRGRPGFGGACNFAAQRSDAPFLLFLNTDCLVSPGTVRKLVAACLADPSIGLACPLSNNSPVLTLPLRPGFSYEEMDALLERASDGTPIADLAPDACTVVGNCLLISRACWRQTGEFDPMWGVGYGEETDYQMRAMLKGFRGVALTNTYVFHFGNASFRYESRMKELQERNYKLFLSHWGDTFRSYAERCAGRDPVAMARARLEGLRPVPQPDIVFLLPVLSQTIGGVHVVIDLCNELMSHGVQARCALLGAVGPEAMREFQEPVYFGLLQYKDERSLLTTQNVAPRSLAATLFSTTSTAWRLAQSRGIPLINFVQGYEVFFENGARRNEVLRALSLAEENIVTSRWLATGIARLEPRRPVIHLPIGVNTYVFSPGRRETPREGKLRLGVALRSAPDKGQWILLEVLHQLAELRDQLSLTVFCTQGYELPAEWARDPDTIVTRMPTDRGTIADRLRQCDLFVDASLHEGFGLMPLEALACGAVVVASDSGGIREFLLDGECGVVVEQVNKPERYVGAVVDLVRDRERLARMSRRAADVGRDFAWPARAASYASYVRGLAGRRERREQYLLALSAETGFAGLEPGPDVALSRTVVPSSAVLDQLDRALLAGRELRVARWLKTQRVKKAIQRARRLAQRAVARVERPLARLRHTPSVADLAASGPLALQALSDDPSVLLPPFEYAEGDVLYVLVDMVSPADTQLALYYATRKAGEYSEDRAVRHPVQRGRNIVLLTLDSQELTGRLRLDPGEVSGWYQLERIEAWRSPRPVRDASADPPVQRTA